MSSNARSSRGGAGRKGSDRGTSQFAESSSRKGAREQQGEMTRGKAGKQREDAQVAHEASSGSNRKVISTSRD